jgi:hypothetical protein
MADRRARQEKGPVSNTKLILHFDIKNTIVMCDLLKETSKEETLIMLIPKYAWGRIEFDEKKNLEYWKLAVNQLRLEAPEEDMINYWYPIDKF